MRDNFDYNCEHIKILINLPFSFLSRAMNFFGAMVPTFFFWVVMLWKRSAKQVSSVSLLRLFFILYSSTFSRNGLQKYRAWRTELL